MTNNNLTNFDYLEPLIPQAVLTTLKSFNDTEVLSEAALCGGALRDLYLGGTVNDYDIFSVVRSGDLESIHEIVNILEDMGFYMQHVHGAGYVEGSDGFIGDWRKGDINFILYAKPKYVTLENLVQEFDLNLNAFIYQPYGDNKIINVAGWDKTKPVEVLNSLKDIRAGVRIPKFMSKYPDLDWSKINA